MENFTVKSIASEFEKNNREVLLSLKKNSPIPDNESIQNSCLFLKRQELSKVLFLNHLYLKILDIHGLIVEFGVRWGQNLVILNNLRGIYEPYNINRKILGFDTFNGFLNTDSKDGSHEIIKEGSFGVSENYESYLKSLLDIHHNESPLNHIEKNFIFKGDASVEFSNYLKNNTETLISLAYFDFDIYKPTKECLELLIPNMVKGGIIAFDEIIDSDFPGETIAYKEVFGNNHKLYKNPFGGRQGYIIFE